MKTLFSIMVAFLLVQGSVKSQDEDPNFDVIGVLDHQLLLIERILPYTLKHRKHTLFTIRHSIEQVQDANSKYNPFHKKVRRAFRMYLVLANTPSFFDAISTKNTEGDINLFLENIRKTAEILGTGESPLSTFTLETFTQIRELLLKLDDHIIFQNNKLLDKQISKKFLDLLTTANGHDTKLMGEKGTAMVHYIRHNLYPRFEDDAVLASSEAFNISIEIRALTEYYYAEYVDDE